MDVPVPSSEERLRGRVLDLLACSEQDYPAFGPGRWSWWRLRQALGGDAGTREVRLAVDRLITEGLVIETREEALVGSTPRHVIVLVSRWHEAIPRPILGVRGRADVLKGMGIITPES